HQLIIEELQKEGIKIGKFQISAALKAKMPANINERERFVEAFSAFNEPTYLHQVIAKTVDNTLLRYLDLPAALDDVGNSTVEEWRAHFHVPLFLENFGYLQSTQNEIEEVMKIQQRENLTRQLEVKTYTAEV